MFKATAGSQSLLYFSDLKSEMLDGVLIPVEAAGTDANPASNQFRP